MTKQERSEAARSAAAARWKHPKADYEDVLRIGELEIPCAVLDDERRILSERGTSAAFSHVRSGSEYAKKLAAADDAKLPVFLQSQALRAFISEELIAALSKPVVYQSQKGGKPARGIPAEILPEICEVFLKARRAGVLNEVGLRKAAAAEILVSGFARVGIVALVDEATGYQRFRKRDALAKILESFVAKELQKWVSTFPPDFYENIYRLHGWKYDPTSTKRTPYVGKITTDIVYDRLAPGVKEELRKVAEKDENGRLKTKLFQGLTIDVGHPRLREHIVSVVTIMKLSDDDKEFQEKLDRVHPKFTD